MPGLSGEFHRENSGHNEKGGNDALNTHRFTQEPDPDHEGADGAYSGPDHVAGSQRKRSHGKRQEAKRSHHRTQHDERRHQSRETLRFLHRESPGYFKNSGQEKEDPRHVGSPSRVVPFK